MFERIQQEQPIGFTGAIRHCGLWVASGASDIIYENPNFQTTGAEDDTAILCIHGTADRASSFSLIAERMLPNLPSTVSCIHLLSFDKRAVGGGIEEFSEQLKNKIIQHGYKKIILMGHSRGGLVAAHYAEYLAQDMDVAIKAIFTIGTPFGGSELAYGPLSWVSESIKQMQPGSQFLSDLAVKLQVTQYPYHCFAAENDLIVSLESTCLPLWRHSLTVLDRHGHLSIMSSHRLVAHLLARLPGVKYENKISAEDVEDVILEFENLARDEVTPLGEVCSAILVQIDMLRRKTYLKSPQEKIDVLICLYSNLEAIRQGARGEEYPHVTTIGEYIDLFMQDMTVMGKQITPSEILADELNYPLTYFKVTPSNTISWMNDLIKKYADTDLELQECLLKNKANYKMLGL